MIVPLVLVGVLALLSLMVAYQNRRRNFLLSKFPGPVFLPIMGSMVEMLIKVIWMNGDMMDVISTFRKKYGSVYVAWTGHLPYIIISNAADAEAVLTHPAVADKGKGYQLIAPWVGDGLLLTGGQKWHSRRKTIAPAFSVKVLEQFCVMFNKHAAILEGKMRQRLNQGPFDVVPLVSLCTLDVISETAMGVQIDAQNKEDSDYVKAVKAACRSFFYRQIYPWLQYESLLRLTSVGKMFYDAIRVLHGLTNKVISQRRSELSQESENLSQDAEDDVGLKQKAVLLDHLLSKALRGENITDRDIMDEVNTFLFAGHDTTMTSLCFTLHLLSTHPEVQDEVHREILDVAGSGAISAQHLNDLKYLECVIKESLRLYPSVPLIVRNCTQEFDLPSGYKVPVGAQLGIDIFQLHRDPDAFPNPEDFNPDRFLGDRPLHHFSYLPFSAAQRNCIGQRFAMMEMKTILAWLIRSLRVLPPSDNYRLIRRSEVVLISRDGIHVQLESRTA